jgi:hypothetical protein
MRKLGAIGAVVFLLCVLLTATGVLAASSGSYGLSWWTVDAGGQTFSTGGAYGLHGTTGQTDAGLLTGGEYTLGGGFWGGGARVAPPTDLVYLPVVLRRW